MRNPQRLPPCRRPRWAAAAAALLLWASPAAAADGAATPAVSAAAPRLALLDVRLNGQPLAPERFLVDAAGALWARRAALADWRIRSAADSLVFEGEHYVPLSALPGFTATLDAAAQRVAIDAAPDAFVPSVARFAAPPPESMTRSPAGAFVNYDAFAEHSRGDSSANAALEFGVFTRHGVGDASLVVRAARHRFKAVRLDTGWTIDRPADMTSLRIGDSISRGGPGTVPLRFAGLQWSRNFAVQPGFVTLPLPSVSGSAALPSVVDVYVDGALRGRREVAPGPFRIDDVPVATGGGEVRTVVRDLLGREVVSAIGYYAASQSLRGGLHDFAWETGFLRRDYGFRSNHYGSAFASTTHRYGVSDRLTLEVHAIAAEHRQVASLGAVLALPALGLATLSASASRGPDGSGAAAALGFERRIERFGLGVRSEFASPDYGYPGLPADGRTPASTLVAFADAAFRGGSIGVNWLRRRNRGLPDEEILGLTGSLTVGRGAALQLYVQRVRVGRSTTMAGLNLTIPFGSRASVSASAQAGGGSRFATLSAQRDAPAGEGVGWRASLAAGDVERADAELVWRGRAFAADVRAVRLDGVAGVRLGASGGFGLVGGKAFASRSLGDSFALVDAGHPGVRVYADNHLIARTGRSGVAVVPRLRAFDANRLAIDPADLPIEAALSETERTVRPYARSGVLVRFDAGHAPGALVRLEANGTPVPAGADVLLDDGGVTVVAPGGEVWIAEAVPGRSGRAVWPGGTCAFRFAAVPLAADATGPPLLPCLRSIDVVRR